MFRVVHRINSVCQVTLPIDPKACLLDIVDEYAWEVCTREAVLRVLFQAHKLIMVHWKSETPHTVRGWVKNIGELLRLEKFIYQHRYKPNKYKFERLWAPWLDVPGASPPVDLTIDTS